MSSPGSRDDGVLVVGGGIAGTMAVLAAISRGLEVTWVADGISAEDQSAHWHGHIHRGRLYDPTREADLIDELACNASFWWSDAVRRFHTGVETIAVGPDDHWAAGFRDRVTGTVGARSRPDFLRPEASVVDTDEAILDGPAFLDAAYRAAARGSRRIVGRCAAIRSDGDRSWRAEVLEEDGRRLEVRAEAVVLATGAAVPELVPAEVRLDLGFGARLSRMLVLKGTLPRTAVIVPSRSAGGLFFASRDIAPDATGQAERADTTGQTRVWLVSDGFSSPGTESPGALTDGWWTCSIVERLLGFVRNEVFRDVAVSGYLGTKFRLASSPAHVPARGVSVDAGGSFVALAPSKWSSSPTSAIAALDAIAPDSMDAGDRLAAMAELLARESSEPVSRFEETWQTVRSWVPFAAVTTPGVESLEAAASVYR
jgi:glycine/D-amino acid oxidase-like deaminating enzyme